MSGLIARTELGPSDGLNFESSWKGDFLQSHLISDVGKKRSNNEDSALFCVPEDTDVASRQGLLFCVADGMGGASAGEYASRMALRVIAEHYFQDAEHPAPLALREAVQRANEKIFEEAEVNPVFSGMGTTVSAVVVHGHWIYVAQVGDSRVYLVRERAGIHQITHDHSLVAEQVRSGLISEEEARNHSMKNLITRAVGIKELVRVDLFAVQIQPGDTLLICSDGLSNLVSDAEIAAALSNGELKLGTRKIVESALDGGGTDNITAISLRVIGVPPKTDFQEGAVLVEIAPASLLSRLRGLFS